MKEIKQAFGNIKPNTVRVIAMDEQGDRMVFEGELTSKVGASIFSTCICSLDEHDCEYDGCVKGKCQCE